MNSIVDNLSKAITLHNSRLWLSNLPPIKPSFALGRIDVDPKYYGYLDMKISEEQQKELNSYIIKFVVDRSDQKEWTEKTIRTREKLEKLRNAIWSELFPKKGFEFVQPMMVVNHLLSSVKVDEPRNGQYYFTVRMLSQKGVDWCNRMWEKVK